MNSKEYTLGDLLENADSSVINKLDYAPLKARLEYYEKAKKLGLLNTNEIRKLEGLPPKEYRIG